MVFGAVFAVLLSLYSLRNLMISTVALEQQARCGVAEHLHNEECYLEGDLSCVKPEHTHNRNCYLVLLKDNDINQLLSLVEADPSRNLETVIQKTVRTALRYNSGLLTMRPQATAQAVQLSAGTDTWLESPEDSPSGVSKLNTSVLNQTIDENNIEPKLVFNEDLYNAVGLEEGPSDTILMGSMLADSSTTLAAAGDEYGTSTLALGAQPATGRGNANIYVNLDGAWRCIGTVTLSASRSWGYYRAYISTSSTRTLIQNSLGVDLAYNAFDVVYAESPNPNSWDDGSVGSSEITLGEDYRSSNSARNAKYVRITDTSGNPVRFYTVTFQYLDGTTQTRYVRSGTSVTLPEDHVWESDNGVEFEGGDSTAITRTTIFTEKNPDGSIRVSYNIDFPTRTEIDSGIGTTVAVEPTLQGTAVQTITDSIPQGSSTVVRNVSQQEVLAKVDGHGADMSRVVRFSGWRVADTDVIISPNATLTWEELQSYASGSKVTLTAVWEHRAVQTASFYVRYDSVAQDTTGNQHQGVVTDYTPELFATFVGGADAQTMGYSQLNDKYYIADTSADNSYGADQAIRARYGEQEGIWLQSFPRDEDVFEQLKAYADQLEVDGQRVNVEDLNPNAYTIRWYVMKCQSDAWHIDGRLVKKEGIMHVTKTFAGNRDGIAKAKESFSIIAANEEGDKRHTLTLNSGSYESYDPATDTYIWKITGVEYGEPWTITEYTYGSVQDQETTYDSYGAYNVVDIFNLDNNKVGDDSDGDGVLSVDVAGQTYATDAGDVQVLRVEFTNVYHTRDSIIIKKEDSKTGNALAGATFRLLQNGQVMRFTYDNEKNQYIYDPAGGIVELSGSSSGYYEIMTTGFTYDNGSITVEELQAPIGYTPIEKIVMGEQGDGTIGILSDSPLASYHNGLLIVENSTENTSVTAVKQWLCPEAEWRDVTVQLLANGNLASALIPGVNATAVLTDDGGWTHTWDNLPTHANGAEIVWSVRETRIGTENCKSDFTFANWLVFYGTPTTTRDENGKVTNYRIVVQNETRRTLLRLTKMDTNGIYQLSGATFTLEHLIWDGGAYVENPDFVKRTMTTGADGTLTFDNLLYGRYRLTEVLQPEGYEGFADPIYLTINEDGSVTVEEHSFAHAGSTAYSIVVYNRMPRPLPNTGGDGDNWYHAFGVLLVLAAVCGYILPKTRYKGRYCSG